jgi:hypothetical protein
MFKKFSVVAVIVILTFGLSAGTLFAGNDEEWDTAGKVLAVIEGARIITGGTIDPLGNIAGIGKNIFGSGNGRTCGYGRNKGYRPVHMASSVPSQRWVPHYVWKRVYVPEREQYTEEYGTVIVEGHYIRYKVNEGGHWK